MLASFYIFYWVICLLNKYLLWWLLLQGTVLNTEDTIVKKTDEDSCPHGAYVTGREADHGQDI